MSSGADVVKGGIVLLPSLLVQFPFVGGPGLALPDRPLAQGILERGTRGIVGVDKLATFRQGEIVPLGEHVMNLRHFRVGFVSRRQSMDDLPFQASFRFEG